MTIAKIFPFTGKRVVSGAVRKAGISNQPRDELQETFV